MGERKLLQRFAAVVWGRPKAWSHDEPNDPAAKARYTREWSDELPVWDSEGDPPETRRRELMPRAIPVIDLEAADAGTARN